MFGKRSLIITLCISSLFPFQSPFAMSWDELEESETSDFDREAVDLVDLSEETKFSLRSISNFRKKDRARTNLEKELFGYDALVHTKTLLIDTHELPGRFEQFIDFKQKILSTTNPFGFSIVVSHLEPYFQKKAVFPLIVKRVGNKFCDLFFAGRSIKRIDGMNPVDYLISQGKLSSKIEVNDHHRAYDLNYQYKIDDALQTIWEKNFSFDSDTSESQPEIKVEYNDPNVPVITKYGFFVPSNTPTVSAFFSRYSKEILGHQTELLLPLIRRHPILFTHTLERRQLSLLAKPMEENSEVTALLSLSDLCNYLGSETNGHLAIIEEIQELNSKSQNLILDLRGSIGPHVPMLCQLLAKAFTGKEFRDCFEHTFSLNDDSVSWASRELKKRKVLLEQDSALPSSCIERFQKEVASLELMIEKADDEEDVFQCSLIAPCMQQDCEKIYHRPVVVLVDCNTCGMAETLAALLQSEGSTVMGEKTRGEPTIEKLSINRVSENTFTLAITPFSTTSLNKKESDPIPLNYLGVEPNIHIKRTILNQALPPVYMFDALVIHSTTTSQ